MVWYCRKHERAQIDHINEVVEGRKEDLEKVTRAMNAVVGLAKDLNVEVKIQGEKLDVIDANVEGAKEHLELGNE